MSYNKHILFMIGAGAILLSGCSAHIQPEVEGIGSSTKNNSGAVTFSVSLETAMPATRLTNDGPDAVSHIGKGEKINKLIYAVYMVDEESGAYELDAPLHPVQTILPADFSNNGRVEFTVEHLMADRTYHIAFWAQNSECDAYDTSDLTKVEVKYTNNNNNANNNELRDAFCQVWTGSFSTDPEQQQPIEVTLRRPLAQINVGTTGADYKNILEGPNVFPHLKITHSRITVNDVARFLNVVDNRVLLQDDMEALGLRDDDAFTNANFDWALIPAFMNMEEVPSTIEDLLYSDGEEFLRTDLNRDGEIWEYLTSYPTLGVDGKTALTETFKYLSMCYVLAPSGAKGNATYGSIKVGFAEDEKGTNGATTISLPNAPGGTNYRTNILAGLAWVKDPGTENPDDPTPPGPDNPDDPTPPGPDNPDDPTPPDVPAPSIFTRAVNIMIQTDFQGSETTDKDRNWSVTWMVNQ